MHHWFLLLLLSLLALSPLAAGPADASPQLSIIEHPLPPELGTLRSITAGPDGSLWFTAGDAVARITVAGDATLVHNFNGPALDIAAGPDGNLWVTVGRGRYGENYGSINRVTIAGAVTREHDWSANRLTAGPDGNLWFTTGSGIGRLTPGGPVVQFAHGAPGLANAITAGPDGNVWFTIDGTSKLGRATPAEEITLFDLPASGDFRGITTGADGNLWFTMSSANRIGRITPAGVVTEFPLPDPMIAPTDITAAPDGHLWFTAGRHIGRISLEGEVTAFELPSSSSAHRIAVGPDGNLWFTQLLERKIGMIELDVQRLFLPVVARRSHLRQAILDPQITYLLLDQQKGAKCLTDYLPPRSLVI